MGKFVVNGAIDATSHITIKNGADLYLQAPASAPDDSGDLIFTKYDGTEQGRIWISGGIGMIRFSGSDASKTLIHSGNIGSQSVNYANSAGNSGTSNGIKLEWSGSIAWADTGWIAAWTSDGSKIKALNKNSFCPASGSDHYVKVYNSSAVGDASGITADTLASQGFAVAMINGATNNPTGAAKWIHCLNMSWGVGDNANWVTQLAFGVENSDGAWYRTNAYTATNKPWKRLLDSSNYTSYTVTKTGGGASGTWGISITGNAATASSASWASGASYTERVAGYYTGNGGAQGPSYIGRGNVKFNMMNQFPNAGTTNYMDCILMNTYGGGDVPRATAFGIERYSGRAWIAEGSDTSSTWDHVYEVISTRNIASQSVNYATTAGQASTANRLTSTTAMWGEPGTHNGKWVKICQETLGGWRNARLVLAISSRYQGTGIFSLTLDVNSAGLAPISGSLNYNGSCPYGINFKAYYNESTGNFTMWMLYNNYSQANITVLESYQWYSSIQYYGVWDTIPSDVGYEIGIKVNAGDTCHNFGANQPSGNAQVGALYYQTIG